MKRSFKISSLIYCFLLFAAVTAMASPPTIDYLGYGWEDGGMLPSEAGDMFSYVGVASLSHPIFGINLNNEEMTFYVTGLTSQGETDLGAGMTMITYSGGMMEIWVDSSQDADFLLTPPSTFNNGSLFFQGAFTDFTIYLAADGSGAFEGSLDGLAGDVIDEMCQDCGYTWGGAFTVDSGAQIPAGYDLQMDGEMSILEVVANEDKSWSSIKNLYR